MKTPHFIASISSWLVMLTSAFAIPEPLIYSNFDGGSGAPGEINGALDTVPGQIADALTFARDDANYVDYGDVASPETGSLTVSFWVNPNQTSGGAFFPLGKGNRSSGTVGWSFFIENDVIIPRANYEGGGGDLRLGLNHPITVDEGWVHMVMVIDNDTGYFTAYYNGEASGPDGTENGWSLGGGGGQTNAFEAGQNFDPSENLLVGRRSSEGAAFDGAVDDVAIWEEALPAADIVQIYERGLIGQGVPSSDRVLAQSIPAKSVGNVATGNSFGMDFEVRAPVLLTDLGAFDSISDGLFQSPTVELWSRDNAGTPDDPADDTGNEILATASFSNEDPGTLEGGVRFKSLDEPVVLPVGDYTIVAYGWGSGEEMSDGRQRGNTGVGELADVFQVAFVGARSGGGGGFPETAEEVGPPNLFGAGNFIVRLLAEDSDGDGLDDGWENFNFGNLTQGSDGDFDEDGASNAREFASDTNPNKADTDEDGLNDGAEDAAGSNPLLVDSDSDGLTDGAEVNDHGTNPTLADTDEDGFIDGVEIALETSPTDAASSPDETSVFLAASGKSWDDPSAWSDGQAPRAGRNYFVLPELATTLLTPTGSPTFAGDSLTLAGEGTELILQPDPTGTVTIANLTMELGSLTHGAVGEITLNGNLEIVDTLTVGFANANSTLDLGSTLTGGALTVANDSEFEDEPTRVLKLTGAGNSLTGDVTLKQVRVLAESAGSLGGGNLFLDNASLEPAYNINNPSKSLDLSGDGTRFLLNGQHVLRQISITGTPFITDAGNFTRDDFVAIDAVFETIFAEESTGNFTIVGNSGDSDEDGLLDSWEVENFGDIATADGGGDPDADALTNAEEFTASADPNKKDTDDDGLEDGAEVNTHGTSPASADTDDDGLSDGDEIAANTNPQEADTDGDGLNDGDEVAQQTDPVNADTDGDGVNDGTELALGGDPLDPNSTPNAFLADLLFYAPLDADDLNLGAGSASEKGPSAFEGTIEGADVAVDAGQIAQSAVFPGVDTDFISFSDEAINAGTDPFSVSFWFKVNVMQNAFMVSRGNRGSSGAGWSSWFENGNLHTRANGVGLGGGDRVGKNFPGIQEGEWVHLAFVFDREQNKLISYTNGSTEGWNVGGGGGQTDNLVPGADFSAGEDLLIGARTGGGFAFNGQIDDVALWKRALSGEEIAMLHQAGLSGRGALDDGANTGDTDGDGMPDEYEVANGLDPNSDDTAGDLDNDGLTNLDEFNRTTDPQNADTDGDGLNDGAEIAQETNPQEADTDGDGLSDGDEVNTHQTSPVLADTDGDGLSDAAEIGDHQTNPLLADSDEDGFGDQVELESGSDPNLAASVPSADLEQGLYAYFPFDDDSAKDVIGERNGTKTNGGPDTSTAGLFGQSATLDGGQSGQDNHYIDLGEHAEALGSLSAGTLSAWIKPDSEDLLTDVLTIMAVSDNTAGSVEMRFWVSNGGAFGVGTVAYGVRGGPAGGNVVARDVNVFDGEWHHVAVSVSEDHTASLFVDGVLQATDTVSFLDIPNANAAAFGRNEDSGGGQWYFAGQLDDVSIWDRPLTAADTFVLHRQGREGNALRQDDIADRPLDILVLGANDAPDAGADANVMAFLEGEFGAARYMNSGATDGSETADVIVMSSTFGSGSVRGKFHNSSVPIVNWEEAIMDSGDGEFGQSLVTMTKSTDTLQMALGNHPIAGGFAGTTIDYVTAGAETLGSAELSAGTEAVGTGVGGAVDGLAMLFVTDAGGEVGVGSGVTDAVSPARRVALPMTDATFDSLTDAGKTLFANAILWAAGRDIPTGVALYAQDFEAANDTTDLGDGSIITSNDGTNSVQGGVLRMTQAGTNSTAASFLTPAFDASGGWTATFDFTIEHTGDNTPADGFSFNYGAIPGPDNFGNPAEEGYGDATPHVSYQVDTWLWNDAAGQDAGVGIEVAGAEVALTKAADDDANFKPGERVRASAFLSWDPANGATFTTSGLRTNADFVNVATPGFTAAAGHGFSIIARTGGHNETLEIDNLVITAGASLPPHPLAGGLVAYYPLDGDLQDNAGDSHGVGKAWEGGGKQDQPELLADHPAAELTFDGGKFGQGVDLDGGAAQYIETPLANEDLFDFGAPDAPTGFTVSAWFRADSFTKGWQALVAKGEQNQWRIHRQGGDTNRLVGNGGDGDIGQEGPDVNDGEIHHILLVSEPGVSHRIFVDGVLIQEGNAPNLENNPMPMMIGQNPDTADRTWDGLIDDVAIWSRALSNDEVALVANSSISLGAIIAGEGPPPPLPPLENVGINANGVFGLTLPDGVTADIEYSTDLINWEVIAAGASGTLEETDAGRIAAPAGYYRANQ